MAAQKQDMLQRYDQTKLGTVIHLESTMSTESEGSPNCCLQMVQVWNAGLGLGIANEDTVEDRSSLTKPCHAVGKWVMRSPLLMIQMIDGG
jgi:hypothetical protein